MKKIILAFILLFVMSGAHGQGGLLKIYQSDGNSVSCHLDSISKFTFLSDTLPKYYEFFMNVFSKDSIIASYSTRVFDSLKVEKDSDNVNVLSIFFAPLSYRLQYPLNNIDSIIFKRRHDLPSSSDTNFNVVRYPFTYGFNGIGNFHTAALFGDRVYCSAPIRYFDLDSSLVQTSDSTLFESEWPLFFQFNSSGSKFLAVHSFYPNVSIGWLEEFKVDSLSFVVIDSGKFTSSAVYLPGSDDIVYYTYGSYSDSNKSPTDAGYYLYERNTGKRIFLLHHISDLGPGEMVNGFDISPDGKKLLIPSVRFERKPILMEYDLTTHTIDTLLVDFDVSFDRFALWVRYNHDGSKILYSNYPLFSFSQSSAANDSSEIGIIDRNTLVKQVLKTNPLNTIPWVSVFPQWSLDEARIIYGCAPLLEDGRAGIYQVCILKSLE